ncbi:MAG: glycosyltransferase family 39 protein [Chitinophagales bacterium]
MTETPEQTITKVNRQQRRWTILVIVLVSLLFRGIYFLQLSDSQALLYMHKWEQSDMHYYYEWAENIEAGDILTNRPFYPYNFWQQQLANYAFNHYPKEARKLIGKVPVKLDEEARNRLLWEKWVGGKVFYADPFYPYWLAFNFKVFGSDVRWIFVWQLLLGVCCNVLIYFIAARYFVERVGIVAAAMAILCGPLMYNDMILIRASWMTFTGLLLVYLLDKLLLQKKWKWWLLYGVLIGVCMLLKSVYSLWLLYVLALVVLTYWRTPKEVVKLGLLLIMGMYIGRAPLIARNLAVGLPASASSGYGAINFIITNHEGYKAKTNGVNIDKSVGLMMESKLNMTAAIVKTLQTYDSPLGYFSMLWQKFGTVWNGYEAADNANFYYYRLHAPILKYLFFSFYWIAPLGIVGFFLALFDYKQFWRPIYAFVVMQVALLTVFFVLSRLRIPLLAMMVPFAAYAVVSIFENRNWRSVAAVFSILVLAYWVHLPMTSSKIRHADYVAPYQVYYQPLIQKAVNSKKWNEAIAVMEDFLQYEPSNIAALQVQDGASKPKINQQDADFYGNVYTQYADFYREIEDFVTAETLNAKAELLKSKK